MPHLSALSLALNRPGAVSAVLTPEQQVAALFANDEQGAWYDPSDYSTMFETAAGASPISTVEKPVGLILDKRKGLGLGAELNDGLGDVANWTALGTNTVGESGDEITVTYVDNAGGATAALSAAAGLSSNLTVGKWYKVTGEAKVNTGSVAIAVSAATTFETAAITSTSFVAFTLYFLASNATTNTLTFTGMGSGEAITVRSLSVKLLDGNHAYQTGSTARPVLRARYNLLTFSEQFDNAAWTPTASTISANTSDTTDPIGTNTAEKYTNTAALDNITRTAAVTVVAGINYTFSIYAKKGTQDWLRLSGWADSLGTTIGFNAWFDLANGQTGSIASGAGGTAVSSSIQNAGNGWYRCTVVGRLTSATTLYPVACMTTADNVATRPATSNVVYFWGADLRVGTSAGDYQQIAAATDYATTSTITGQPFRPYLEQPTGGDDSLIVANSSFNDFAASDAPFFMSAGVTRYGTTRGTIFCLADDTNATAGNNDTLNLEADSTAQVRGYLLDYDAGGNTEASATAGTLAAQATFIASWQRTATDGFARNNGTAGTGTDQTAPAVVLPLATVFAQRRGTSPTTDQRFTGRMFGLIVRAGTISAGQMSTVETYLAGKSGVTL